MSLTFKSVKKISRKKRKGGHKSKTRKFPRDPFELEDNPFKFTVEGEETDSEFPTLNSVYNTDLFGTPVTFKNGYGSDCMKFIKIKTRLQSIVFMNEYTNKSFEELRWDDYQSNRKGSQIFEEMNYLKCLSKDKETSKWKTILPPKKLELTDPVTKNVFGKFPALSYKPSFVGLVKQEEATPERNTAIVLQQIKEEPIEVPTHKEIYVRPSKERSILTNVDKYPPKENNCVKEFLVDTERKEKPVYKTTSEINLKYKKEQMVKENLQRYFSCAYSNAAVAYEFFPQNNNNYYLPCTNISLAYKNTNHSKSSSKTQSIYFWDTLNTNPFGYHPIFNRLDPIVEKETLYGNLFGVHNCKVQKHLRETMVVKYTSENKFSKKYFWSKFSPYPCTRIRNAAMKGRRRSRAFGMEKFTKSKHFWMGLDVVA